MKRSAFGRTENDRAYIDDSRVACPLRGRDVTIEDCLICGKLQRIVEDDPPYLVCTARRDDLRTDAAM